MNYHKCTFQCHYNWNVDWVDVINLTQEARLVIVKLHLLFSCIARGSCRRFQSPQNNWRTSQCAYDSYSWRRDTVYQYIIYRRSFWQLLLKPRARITSVKFENQPVKAAHISANQINLTADRTENNEVIPRTNCHDHSTQYLIFLHAHTSHYHVTQWGNFTATSHTAQTDTNWLNTIRFKLSFNLFLTIIATLSIMCKIC